MMVSEVNLSMCMSSDGALILLPRNWDQLGVLGQETSQVMVKEFKRQRDPVADCHQMLFQNGGVQSFGFRASGCREAGRALVKP